MNRLKTPGISLTFALAIAVGTVPATGVAAATTQLAVPSVPYVAITNVTYQLSDSPITPATTSLTYSLPDGVWTGRGITSLTYRLLGSGSGLTGTAQIDGASNTVSFSLPPNFTSTGPGAPNADGTYTLFLQGDAAAPSSVPRPSRSDMAKCDPEPGNGYQISLVVPIPYVATPGAAAVSDSLDKSKAVRGQNTGTGDALCYWVVPTPQLALAPGDSVTYTAASPSFTGTWTAQVGIGGGGGGPDPVALTTSVANGSTTLTATVPADADLSPYANPGAAPSLGLFRFDAVSGDSVNIETPMKVKGWSPTVTRIAGRDRFDTSVAVSKAGYPSTAPVVVVATGLNYPDALAAGPAAAKLGGPLLLTSPSSLPASVSNEIKRLKPAKVVIVGGQGAVSAAVEGQLRRLAGTVVRIAGSDRFSTARQIVQYAFTTASKAYVATGLNYPDALSAAAAAGSQGLPVVLVNGSAGAIDTATKALLTSRGVTSVTIVGGIGAVSTGLESSLKTQLGSGAVKRLSGADRFSTSVLVAKEAFTTSSKAFVATGLQFPDALAGSALAAAQHAPLFTSRSTCLPAAAKQEMQSLGVTSVTLVGGVGALSVGVAALIAC